MEFAVLVKTLTGASRSFTVRPTTTGEQMKMLIQECYGYPLDQQRLLYNGRQLDDWDIFEECGIQANSTLHLIMRLRGMISIFKVSSEDDSLSTYLMLSDDERARAEVPLEDLQRKFEEENAGQWSTFAFTEDAGILGPAVRRRLSEFLDFMWSRETTDSSRVDLRMHLPDEEFILLLATVGNNHAEILEALRHAFTDIPGTPQARGESKIALRMTRGPSNGCINFHCDGGYATGTVQIALSEPSEYQGGRLCFFVNDRLHVLERPAGSMCQHPRAVLHAVTALTGGTRKSLFVVDKCNGLGENGVVVASREDVQEFLELVASREPSDCPQVQMCCMCLARPSACALLPCGHLCVCPVCSVSADLRACPVCRSPVQQTARVFV
ncbi:UBC [Symbiodinium natans]|uniref:UBC protein n=1 Tax=Symbiodinium natans TaxID=878477 RepID=A0A812QEB8_9DINO|nr:UBC [Symbiodinium natans]